MEKLPFATLHTRCGKQLFVKITDINLFPLNATSGSTLPVGKCYWDCDVYIVIRPVVLQKMMDLIVFDDMMWSNDKECVKNGWIKQQEQEKWWITWSLTSELFVSSLQFKKEEKLQCQITIWVWRSQSRPGTHRLGHTGRDRIQARSESVYLVQMWKSGMQMIRQGYKMTRKAQRSEAEFWTNNHEMLTNNKTQKAKHSLYTWHNQTTQEGNLTERWGWSHT